MTKPFAIIKPADLAAGIFIILFTYTAVNKLIDFATFRIALVQSPLLQSYAGFLLIAIPAVELIAVALLSFSATRKTGLYISWVLMCVFTIYISYLMLFAKDLPCNCGGILKILSWKAHLVVNLVLLGLATWALYFLKSKKNISNDNRISRAPV